MRGINFYEIEMTYPKSMKRLREAVGELMFDRELYDFFDGEGIFISIVFRSSLKFPFVGIIIDWQSDGFKNRNEAEHAAYLRAFELLEQKLLEQK